MYINSNNINYQSNSSFRKSQNNNKIALNIDNKGMILPETNFTGIKFRSVSTSNNNNHSGNYNNINYNNGELLAHRYGNTSNSNKARNNTKDRKLNPDGSNF